jgi:hypothetical protein
MAADIDQDVIGTPKQYRYTDSEDTVSARTRKGRQWFFVGRDDAEAQLAGKKGFILSETLWLIRVRYKWPESAVEEYLRGYRSVIKDG